MSRFYLFIFFFSVFFLQPALGIYPRIVPVGDNNYLIYEAEDYKIIFAKQYEPHLQEIAKKVNYYFNLAKNVHGTRLSEPLIFTFLSDKLQISNAAATLFPFFQTLYFPSGLMGKDLLASPYWLDSTLYHEITHIFQLQNSVVPPKIRRFIKSPLPLISIFFNMFPNSILPMIILEGDATLKESMVNKGGRLYSGYGRALVYAQIKKYKPRKLSRILVNQRIHPHNGFEKYLHGGYLASYLHQKYSSENLIHFFKSYARSKTFFLISSFTFFNSRALSKHFKSGFQDLTHQYVNHYKKQALLQKSSPEKILFTSSVCPAFNVSEDSIYFLTSNSKNQSYIRTYNTQLKHWSKKRTQLFSGKLFKINNRYHTRTSHALNPTSISYSLFSESARPLKNFNSKYVEDIKGKDVLYTDATNTLNGFRLYLNDQFYSLIHSNAFFDSDRNIYFFKQDGNVRTLYKNKRPLFAYYGYYGNIVDVDSKGTIYFTGSTPYGSSIFQYKENTLMRSVLSDTVVRARKVDDDRFLVCEVDAEGFNYKMIPIEETYQHPTLYRYPYEDSDSYLTEDIEFIQPDSRKLHLEPLESDPLEEEFYEPSVPEEEFYEPSEDEEDLLFRETASLLSPDYNKYRAFRNIKYSSLLQSLKTSILIQEEEVLLNTDYHLTLIFSDYLSKHNIFLNYRNFNISNMSTFISYENRVHPLTWEVGYQITYAQKRRPSNRSDLFRNEFQTLNIQEIVQGNNFTHSSFLNLTYPLLRRGHWSSNVGTYLNLGIHPLQESSPMSPSYLLSSSEENATHFFLTNTVLSWNLGYFYEYPLSVISHRQISLNLFTNHTQVFLPYERNANIVWGGNMNLFSYLGYNFYINPSFWYIQSSQEPLTRVRVMSEQYLSVNYFNVVRVHEELYISKTAGKASLTFLRPFAISHLSKYILSLNYLIPYFESSYKYLDEYFEENSIFRLELLRELSERSTGSIWLFEWRAGVDLIFLVNYNTRVSTTLSVGRSLPVWTQAPPSTLFNFSLNSNF